VGNDAAFMEYIVRPGDTLAKIATAYYGDPRAYVRIAQANGLSPHRELSEGIVLRIPTMRLGSPADELEEVSVTAQRLPSANASNTTIDPATGIETVTVEASRLPPWLMDWKTWVLAGVAGVILWNWLEDN
jgi:hypothetical protein